MKKAAKLDEARAFGPASVANLGPGYDCLGAALDGPGDVVVARVSRTKGITLEKVSGDRGRLPKDPARNTAAVAAACVLEDARRAGLRGLPPGLTLELRKGLPLASGLGSSAASAVAGAYAAALVLGISDKRKLLRAVLVGEHAADGSWHGDNAFPSLLGGLLLVPSSNPLRLSPRPVPLPVPENLRLVLVHPELELPTAESRAVLPKEIPMGVHVAQSAALARLVAALFRGDVRELGRAVSSDDLVEPRRAPLVRGYASATRALRKAGALGVALAGAGPSLVAIAESDAGAAGMCAAGIEGFKASSVEATSRVHRVDTLGARSIDR
ncbi:MAG: homoserine kinase [Acidobacteria bacterium]|nr:homoserine kinase [Acidobacteriota bacterium]